MASIVGEESPCRWAKMFGTGCEGEGQEHLADLPVKEQVARGQELLGMLKKPGSTVGVQLQTVQPWELKSDSSSVSPAQTAGGGKKSRSSLLGTVVVKHTFIEVKMSAPVRRSRTFSDSVAFGLGDAKEQLWQKLSPDVCGATLTDASTSDDDASTSDCADSDDAMACTSRRDVSATPQVLQPAVDDSAPTTQQVTQAASDSGVWMQCSTGQGVVQQGFAADAMSVCAAPPLTMYFTDLAQQQQPCAQTWWTPEQYFDCAGNMLPAQQSYDQQQAWLSQPAREFVPAMPPGVFDPAPIGWQQPASASTCSGSMGTSEARTTVMLRNIPNNCTRDMLREIVEAEGFAGEYDFLYLPIDFSTQAGLGYAFVNFVNPSAALRCFQCMEGFERWPVPSDKVCSVTWGMPHQGLHSHIERYRNSPVMHESIPDMWKPALFAESGRRLVFPPPTKPIPVPKVRQRPEKALKSQ